VRAIVGSGPHEAITGHDWDLRVPEIEIAPYQVLWFLQQD
jgi:hypothetical protein